MSQLAITKITTGTIDQVCEKVTEALKTIGFGLLTRIDFDQKIKEKLNENINRTVILGVCHPRLAYEAFQQSKEVALLIPCNIVVRETSEHQIYIEAARPTAMLSLIKDLKPNQLAQAVEADLEKVILSC